MSKRVAVFGGSFNPPGLHHRNLVAELCKQFDEVIIVPCGPRPDKPTTNDVEPIHRAIMTDLTFHGLQNASVELFDLEQLTFTRTHELEERFKDRGEIWHVVGSDLTHGGKDCQSFVHKVWERGAEVWNNAHFAVVSRKGFEHDSADLPPNSVVVEGDFAGSSFHIREKAFRRESLVGLVTPHVLNYIDRYRLYRGTVTGRSAKLVLDEPRLMIAHDERNPKAAGIAAMFQRFASDDPNCILAIGGDGTMLQVIREHWRLRLPFFGVNAGHLGFLLNGASEVPENVLPEEGLLLHHLPLLYVETQGLDGEWRSDLAFNDTWIERASSQAAWVEVKVDGQVRIPRLVADGALLSTAAGSTAYARSMGAQPLMADAPALVLVGSNAMVPPGWKSALLPLDSEVDCTTLGGEKRPLDAYVDGIPQGRVQRLRARVSRIAAVELAYVPTHDMAEKIAQIQFPTK